MADELREAIGDGTYPAGAQLPSESELMSRYAISRGTVRQTFAQLQREGLVSSRQGSRRVVVDAPRLCSFERLISFSLWVRSLGEVPSGRLVRLVRRDAEEEEREALGLEIGERVFHMLRVRLISGCPAMVERTVYPEDLGRIVAGMDLDHESITEHLEALGYAYSQARHTIGAMSATPEDAQLLEIAPQSPLLRHQRLVTDPDGRPIEWTEDRYRADSMAFSVTNSRFVNNLSRGPAVPEER